MRRDVAIGRIAMWDAFGRDERGGVLPLVALSLVVILGIAALAIDVGQQHALRAQLQATADAAALAAAAELPNEKKALKRAEEYVELNMPEAKNGRVLREEDVIFGMWQEETRQFIAGGKSPNAVQISVRRSSENGNAAPTFFMHIFGRDHADLSAEAMAGVVLFPGKTKLEDLDEDDMERLAEMKDLLEREQKERARKHRNDPREWLNDEEAARILLEEFGRAVLLK